MYHVSFDIEPPLTRTFEPRVPQYRCSEESSSIPRICFTPSVKHCFDAMPDAYLPEVMLQDPIPFVLFQFKCDEDDPALVRPEALQKTVPDAYWTQEHWYTKPVTLTGTLYNLYQYAYDNRLDAKQEHREAILKVLEPYREKFHHFNRLWQLEQVDDILDHLSFMYKWEIADRLNLPMLRDSYEFRIQPVQKGET